jgi:peptidyl-tRNA hydrolase, PTH1 family
MELIVGLGNVGAEYELTPHNLGFRAVDALAGKAGIRVSRPESQALVGLGKIAGRDVALAKPQTMMNLSGSSVRALLERYEASPADLIVLIDEVDLPWGMLRIRERGRNSTHNGLQSIIGSLGTDEFIRVRLGCRPEKLWGDRRDYVLREMNREERQIAEDMVIESMDAVELILTDGVERAMTRYNRKNSPQAEGDESLE